MTVVVDYLAKQNLVFDRSAVRKHRDRPVASIDHPLVDEVADRLADRLLDVRREFPLALDIGHRCAAAVRATGRVQRLVVSDYSPRDISRDAAAAADAVVADEEFLPFAPTCFDLVVSSLVLHWTNDLPGALTQLQRTLKPDGLFLGALFAGETLHQLREVLIDAELAAHGGASPRISPMIEVAEMSSLLQRAGFALPVVDTDSLTLTYPDAFALMADLRSLGETNALRTRQRHFTSRTLLFKAAELYQQRHAQADGRIRATFQIAYLTGWSPDSSQQQPLRPGSAAVRLADALETRELSAGEKAEPSKPK